ncbi:MAG: amidohydrolase family protein [Chloroflexi bacterium]|nr:amidohydrolase family protein [Chloroflexota bacterium]
MIIDTHTHFYDPTRPQGVPWPAPDDKVLYRTVLPEDFAQVAVPEGVTGTVVVEASGWLEDNQWVLDLAAANPLLVGLVGQMEPGSAAFDALLARFAANPLLRGIRCGGRYFVPPMARYVLADLEKLSKRGLSLDLLIGPQQIDGVVDLARQLPELRIVINHIAAMPITGRALDSAWVERYQALADHPNLSMKVSALLENSTVQPAPTEVDFYRPTLDALWQTFGADRLIYGSNWPVCEHAGTYATTIAIVKKYFAEKGEDASAKYFWKNSKRVYQWLDRN